MQLIYFKLDKMVSSLSVSGLFCFKRIFIAFSLLAGLLANSSALAQLALEDISFTALEGNQFEIQLDFNGTPPEPEIFEVVSPARLSMDFANVVSRLDERRYPLQFNAADSVMVLESQGRTRMVVNLTEPSVYSSRVVGNQMFVVVGESVTNNAVSSRSQGTVSRGAAASTGSSDITFVDFRRNSDGGGQISIELANNSLIGNLNQTVGNLELEFLNAELASSLQQRLDVTDYGTPVQYIDVYSENGAVMIVSIISGEYEYVAFQGNQEYIINVTPVVPTPSTVGANTGDNYDFSGETISLNYPNIPIRDALQLLADFNDFNLVVSDSVSGNTTLRLIDAPWEQALDLVLRSGGLARRMEGNVMYVAPTEEIVSAELSELESAQQAEVLAPLYTEYIEVNYAEAVDIQTLLSGTGEGDGSLLSSRGSSSVDVRTNTLIVQDVASVLVEVRDMMSRLDVPVRQVLVEARIVNAETSFSEALGVRWSGGQNFPGATDNLVIGGNLGAVTTGALNGGLTSPSLLVDLAAESSSSIALGYAGARGMLSLELSALEDSGKGEVIAQPSVITLDQQLAEIQSGLQIPYQSQAGGTAGGSITAFVDAVLSLKVTPQITPDGRIIMELDIHQDSVVPTPGSGAPAISTNSVATRVLVENGDTIVLGGVFREEEVTSISKTMVLGDIPYIGNLFKSSEVTDTKTELLIFITPSIIDGL